jgi:hypothetical protein
MLSYLFPESIAIGLTQNDLFSDNDQVGKKRNNPPIKKLTSATKRLRLATPLLSSSSSSSDSPSLDSDPFLYKKINQGHISPNFYPDISTLANTQLLQLPYFEGLTSHKRTIMFCDMNITFQTALDKWHMIPYPLTAFF